MQCLLHCVLLGQVLSFKVSLAHYIKLMLDANCEWLVAERQKVCFHHLIRYFKAMSAGEDVKSKGTISPFSVAV